MTRQFYKPPKGFPLYYFSRSGKPLGGFFVLLGRRQSGIPTTGLRFALRGSADHAFFFLAGKYLAFPKYTPPLFNQPFGFVYTFGTAKREPNRREKRENLSRKRVSPFRLHRLPAHTQSNLLADSPTGSRLYQGFSRTLNPRAEFAVNRIARLAFLHGFLWCYSPSVLVRPLYPLYNGLP